MGDVTIGTAHGQMPAYAATPGEPSARDAQRRIAEFFHRHLSA